MALVDGVCDSRLEFVPVLDEHNNLKHINADCKAGLVCVCVGVTGMCDETPLPRFDLNYFCTTIFLFVVCCLSGSGCCGSLLGPDHDFNDLLVCDVVRVHEELVL